MAQNRTPLTGGPSKFELMESLFGRNIPGARTVHFKTRVGFANDLLNSTNFHSVTLMTLQREDGSSHAWHWQGYQESSSGPAMPVSGYFVSDQQSGWIDTVDYLKPITEPVINPEAYDKTIVEGPSRFDLMLSLFEGDFSTRRKVTFKVVANHNVEGMKPTNILVTAFINGLAREGNSEHLWHFRGYQIRTSGETKVAVPIQGNYNSKKRTGKVVWPLGK